MTVKRKPRFSLWLSVIAVALGLIGAIGYFLLEFVTPLIILILSPLIVFIFLITIVAFILLPFFFLAVLAFSALLFALKLVCVVASVAAIALGVVAFVMSGEIKEKIFSVSAIVLGGSAVLTLALLTGLGAILALISVIAVVLA